MMPCDSRRDADEPVADAELEALLARLPVPEPSPGLFERALAHAREAHAGGSQGLGKHGATRGGVAGRVAAGVAVLAVAGLLALAARETVEAVPRVTVRLNEPETVRLVFAAEDALEHATMTVRLPDGVELAGFPGEREIRWDTSLAEGSNLLPLTLIATSRGGGELTARLEHEARDRTFRVRIDVG